MEEILIDVKDRVATVTLDAPPVNTLTIARYEALTHAFLDLARRDDVNVVIFTAKGTKAFCAGKDLKEFLAARPEDDPAVARTVRATFEAIRHCPVPVIAAINGPALGAGWVLTSVCDIRIASERATFALPEVNIGRCGGGAHTMRLAPQGTLRLMAFTGEAISAWEAHRLGMVEQVVPSRRLMAAAYDIASAIAAKSPIGVRTMKKALNEIEPIPVDEAYRIEQGYSTQLMETHDAREAVRAAVEKRAPVWTGR